MKKIVVAGIAVIAALSAGGIRAMAFPEFRDNRFRKILIDHHRCPCH